ncbi:ABC transporter permease subunit [Kibdelosporangium persicum]|uniref:ABC-2 type transport system permease protein n=1 Tax=Kibdelosporangium persicum TaxID=2698649 RepID=A0ABX2F120_9PSEU|nr:ABC transporter permease subunit [Kibdelosporangium persicum]NRN65005.1 ABC-2 type transport system permease protein [Kibdelosporangium persicum]
MTNLIRAELLRVTRSMWLVAAIAVVACVGWGVLQVVVFMTPETVNERSVNSAYSMAQQGYVFAMILGIIVVTGEYRHHTITWAFLVTPRRGHVITAKLLASGVIGLALGVAAALVTSPVAAALLSFYDYPVWTPDVPFVLLGSVVSTVLWCLFGAALGALVRNMVAAITAAFVWFFYLEWALVMLVPAVGRWTPTGAGKAVSGWTRDALSSGPFAAGDLLPMWAGGLLMISYAVTAAVAARLINVRRDVT